MRIINKNPFNLILLAGGIALLVHGVNIIFNSIGYDSEFLTGILDTGVNLVNNLVGIVFLVAVALYFLNKFKR